MDQNASFKGHRIALIQSIQAVRLAVFTIVHFTYFVFTNGTTTCVHSVGKFRTGTECFIATAMGYKRSMQRDDGAIVTVYYYNDAPQSERYIAATTWSPPARR